MDSNTSTTIGYGPEAIAPAKGQADMVRGLSCAKQTFQCYSGRLIMWHENYCLCPDEFLIMVIVLLTVALPGSRRDRICFGLLLFLGGSLAFFRMAMCVRSLGPGFIWLGVGSLETRIKWWTPTMYAVALSIQVAKLVHMYVHCAAWLLALLVYETLLMDALLAYISVLVLTLKQGHRKREMMRATVLYWLTTALMTVIKILSFFELVSVVVPVLTEGLILAFLRGRQTRVEKLIMN